MARESQSAHRERSQQIVNYLFAQRQPDEEKFAGADLEQIKKEVEKRLERLWDWLRKDAESRLLENKERRSPDRRGGPETAAP